MVAAAPPPTSFGSPSAQPDDKKAKSRAIQARYRQRQKESKQQLIQQYAATAAALEEERRLNAALRHAEQIMSVVRDSREYLLGLLQAASSQGGPGDGGGSSSGSDGEGDGHAPAALARNRLPPPQALEPASFASSGGGSGTAALRNLLSLPFERRVSLCWDALTAAGPALRAVMEQGGSSGGLDDGFAMEMRAALAKRAALAAAITVPSFWSVFALVLVVPASQRAVIGLFTAEGDGELLAKMQHLLCLLAVMLLFDMSQGVMSGVACGAGKQTKGFSINALAHWICYTVLVYRMDWDREAELAHARMLAIAAGTGGAGI
ncbi:hypothetical protein ABPG75_003432 [Micractinium tetrahymenae]